MKSFEFNGANSQKYTVVVVHSPGHWVRHWASQSATEKTELADPAPELPKLTKLPLSCCCSICKSVHNSFWHMERRRKRAWRWLEKFAVAAAASAAAGATNKKANWCQSSLGQTYAFFSLQRLKYYCEKDAMQKTLLTGNKFIVQIHLIL